MTDENFLPSPADAPPANLFEMPSHAKPRIKRRARSLTPADAPGVPATANLNSSEPPHHFRELLQSANEQFRPRNKFCAALADQSARALWGMRRVDESMSLAVDVEIDSSWDDVDAEFEEVDLRCRALLATAQIAARPLARYQLAQGNFALRGLALTSRLLTAKPKAA